MNFTKTNMKYFLIFFTYILIIITISATYIIQTETQNGDNTYDFVPNKYHFEAIQEDRLWFLHIGYNTLSQNSKHRVIVSDFDNPWKTCYTEWQNYTISSQYHRDVEFNIPSTAIKPNSTTFCKTQIYDQNDKLLYQSKVQEFTNRINQNSRTLTQLVKSGEEKGYDYPWNWCHEIIWDTKTQKFWHLSSGEKEFVKKAWTSDKPYDWEYVGPISTEFPNGWRSHKGVTGYIMEDNTHIATINIQDGTGTGAALYTGDSFINMTLQGILFRYGENVNCSVNCRLNEIWFNKTDNSWYGYISGSSVYLGTRTHAYLAQSENLNFTGKFDPSPLYYNDQWGNTSWTTAGIYPPNSVWLNGRGLAGVKGYANKNKPYDFDADLIFMKSPRDISSESFYSPLDSKDAYLNTILKYNDTQRTVPVIQDGIVWIMARNGVRYNATGCVMSLCGFWANETVSISPGYNPLYRYSNLPTKEQFKNTLNVTAYIWENEANITINHIKKESPEYARISIQGTSGDLAILHIKNIEEKSLYLHTKIVDQVNILTITDKKEGALEYLPPTENGDLLFKYWIQ